MNKKNIIALLIALVVASGAVIGVNMLSGSDSSSTEDTMVSTSTGDNNAEDVVVEMDDAEMAEAEVESEPAAVTTISFGESNLEPLASGRYELWGNVNGEVKSITRFSTLAELEAVELEGDVEIKDLRVSIEEEGATNSTSSGIIVAQGATEGRLTFEALDLSTVSGEYITGTPSNDPEGFENSGLWFAKPGNPPSASLNIPNLGEAKWIYEGWAVHQGVTISTGTFKDAASGDNFGGYNGPGGIPNLPGEDFLQNLPGGLIPPIDLGDGSSKAVVTLEPYLNGQDPTGTTPFQIKFLQADIPAGVQDHVLQPLTLDTSGLPYLDVTIN